MARFYQRFKCDSGSVAPLRAHPPPATLGPASNSRFRARI